MIPHATLNAAPNSSAAVDALLAVTPRRAGGPAKEMRDLPVDGSAFVRIRQPRHLSRLGAAFQAFEGVTFDRGTITALPADR